MLFSFLNLRTYIEVVSIIQHAGVKTWLGDKTIEYFFEYLAWSYIHIIYHK